jgi:hypothetical protein
LQCEIPIFLFKYIDHKNHAAISIQRKVGNIKIRLLVLKKVEHGNNSTLRWQQQQIIEEFEKVT